MMRRVAVGGLVCLALAACSPCATRSAADCASALEYGDGRYLGHVAHLPAERLGSPVAGAVQLACNDTSCSDEKDRPVTARSLDGVDPAVAVAYQQLLYVRDGTDLSVLPQWLVLVGEPPSAG